MRTAYTNGKFITVNGQNQVIEDGVMVVEDGKIHSIGEKSNVVIQNVDHTVDLCGKWVLPGLINAHAHTHMTILRGIGDDMQLKEWLETRVWPAEGRYTTETSKWSTALGIVEMLKSGTTMFSDMFNPMNIDADEIASFIGETGIRSVFSRTLFSFGSEEEQRESVKQSERFAEKWKSAANGRLSTMVAPHAPYTCTTRMLEEAIRIADDHSLPVHIHASESTQEVQKSIDDYGKRPVAYLQQIGMFNQPTVIAHGVHLNQEDLGILAENNVAIAHNPVSNLKLGSGIANVPEILKRSIQVGIGTDSVASNNNLDMFQELRFAALLQKGVHEDARLMSAETVLRLATIEGAHVIRQPQLGSLEPGKEADFITINPKDKSHLQPEDYAVSHIVYSASGQDVSDVYVQGKALVLNGTCQTIDEEKVLFEAKRLFKQLSESVQ
ncbi:amidohydrolase family protein [Jeotgalibacillus marinus]|uniref:5-methylthioadenosine/S-adenosylhomocysteine deaminase n=1 Tax=Jeotgalibacillus marinus TaxID=86667 RepID=A0ABV3Q6A5_9BACL